MEPQIQLLSEKRMFTRTITGSMGYAPEFAQFKDRAEEGRLSIGSYAVGLPRIDVEIKAEKGFFSTTYTVLANFSGAMPLSAGNRLSGFAEVSPRSVRYFTPEGESAGVESRKRIELEKAPGISSAMGDEYSLGIMGNLTAVMKMISDVPLFKAAALQVLKAVATEAGDIKAVPKG